MTWLWVIIGVVWVLGMPVYYGFQRQLGARPDAFEVAVWLPLMILVFLVVSVRELIITLSNGGAWLASRGMRG
jgi:hypothetical protein